MTGIAARLGGMLAALLYALLGWGRRGQTRARAESLEGVLAPVLAAEAAIDLEFEPYVEWEAVPAPWRNGQLLPARHARALSVALPCRRARIAVRGQGPPRGISGFGGVVTGMA